MEKKKHGDKEDLFHFFFFFVQYGGFLTVITLCTTHAVGDVSRADHYDSSAFAAAPSNGEYLAADADDPAAEGECRFWYLAAGRPSAASGDGSDSADDDPVVPGGECAGL